MSAYAAFRRQPVPQQLAQNLATITIPVPTRGIIQSENEAFMVPGGALVQTNWASTMKGVKLRGGYVRWCDLHAFDIGGPSGTPAWKNTTFYSVGNVVSDPADEPVSYWQAVSSHMTPPGPTTFFQFREEHPEYWVIAPTPTASPLPDDDPARMPVVSSFEYKSGVAQRMYAANATKLFDVTSTTPSLIKDGQNSGNYFAAQMANLGGDWMIVGNDAGDPLLRTKDGEEFFLLSGVIGAAGDGLPNITYDPDSLPPGVTQGLGLVYAWKYRNRLFFIQQSSMNAWYLPIDAVGGVLLPITLGGAAEKGGKLLFGATWSIDAGDGIDDKCVFMTDLGELLIFTGSNPSDSANWRQEGRYQIGAPLGMNAHMLLGGDLLIMTVDGIVPTSQAITKDSGQLDLALLTKPIKPLWRDEVAISAKRAKPWTMKTWDEYGAIFVTTPGGNSPSTKHCLVINNATGAWSIYTWDVTCLLRTRADMFFGTQDGRIMQADRSGYDDGLPYVATLVGGWELFQSGSAQVVWHQARAVFSSSAHEPFQPQLTATTDYVVTVPPPPPAGPDPGLSEVWDEGLWDVMHWDMPALGQPPIRNTLWVSIGMSGFAHAPIVQVTVAQAARPNVELIAIGTTQERGGVNV